MDGYERNFSEHPSGINEKPFCFCVCRWNNMQNKGSDGMVRMVKTTIHSQLF